MEDVTDFNVVFVFREPCDRCGEERICIGIEVTDYEDSKQIETILCEECVRKGFAKAKEHYRSTIEM